MDKVVRNGFVAVLYSPGYGAGWFSWNSNQALIFDPEIVKHIEAGDKSSALDRAKEIEPGGYFGGLDDLKIEWIAEGVVFRIDEYDGSESIVTNSDDHWISA